jgi:hypothetical protein
MVERCLLLANLLQLTGSAAVERQVVGSSEPIVCSCSHWQRGRILLWVPHATGPASVLPVYLPSDLARRVQAINRGSNAAVATE